MEPSSPMPRYGVREQVEATTPVERAAESLGLLGYAVLDPGLPRAKLDALREAFERAHRASLDRYGEARLEAIDERNQIRCPLSLDRAFLDLALEPTLLALAERMLGPGFILNQQNGLVNPRSAQHYGQAAWHRDLPYQHYTSSRPLAINAVFCIDDFTEENGATVVIPGSHRQEKMPSDGMVREAERVLPSPAGTFLVLDCMTYHRGGVNRTARDRRGVNHVFSIGLLRQQIDLPSVLGEGFTADPAARRLLGYDFRAAGSVEAFYAMRERKLSR